MFKVPGNFVKAGLGIYLKKRRRKKTRRESLSDSDKFSERHPSSTHSGNLKLDLNRSASIQTNAIPDIQQQFGNKATTELIQRATEKTDATDPADELAGSSREALLRAVNKEISKYYKKKEKPRHFPIDILHAFSQTGKLRVESYSAVVFSSPKFSVAAAMSKPVARLKRGELITALGLKNDYWVRVRTEDGKFGWVMIDQLLIEVTPDIDSTRDKPKKWRGPRDVDIGGRG